MGARRASHKAVEWPTAFLIVSCYALWAGTLLVWMSYPVIAMLVLGVTLAMQSSLMHEASHGHPTRKAWLNELLVGLPIGLAYPYRRFKTLHLRHHADERLTDPFEDPESYYRARWQHERLPGWLQTLLRANNTMLGRFIIGPWLGTAGFISEDWRLLRSGDRAVRKAWALHVFGLLVVLPFVTLIAEMPLWLYVLGPVWLGQSLISVRTFAEHQWSERPDGRTLIVERSPFAFLFLNNNLHLVHHKNPTVAWYRLPTLFRERRAEWIRMNDGYVFPNYWSLFRTFALKAKEPVVHPFLRRMPEAGRVFRPRVRANNVHGLGTIVVPSQPPKD
ncbi:fatty acid desaturase [Mesorhizobium sp. RP14(2022)]|uniref:Fatty acid desaturase n=1 Tax=Mesorhizobium liriopis TaxID=2953882 RepID=A0ABT1C5K0_9HYPH|nr:fatty acid desaturase [Mesorhizobium liriopis]MCO6050100.1 fatty acid desaturase [Mesorhizobium liriopis]